MNRFNLEKMDEDEIRDSITDFRVEGHEVIVEFGDFTVPVNIEGLHGVITEDTIATYIFDSLANE